MITCLNPESDQFVSQSCIKGNKSKFIFYPLDNEWAIFLSQLRLIASRGEFGKLIYIIENFFPNVSSFITLQFFSKYPKTLFYIYKCWFLTLRRCNLYKSAEEIFEKFIYPLYLKYAKMQEKEDINMMEEGRNINERIENCINKIMDVVSNEKRTNTLMEMEDVDYDQIHEEIIDSIVPSENESGLSDLEEEFEAVQLKKRNIFQVKKVKNVVDKSTEEIFKESQNCTMFNPLNSITCSDKSEEKNEKENETYSESGLNTNTDAPLSVSEKSTIYKDQYSNYNKYNRDCVPKIVKPTERFKNRIPFLKSFNPKFLKKENIDKKIFRRFRNFVKEKYDVSQSLFFDHDNLFWKEFCNTNLLPPMKYTNPISNRTIEFKSFNTKYFLWLFNQKGTFVFFNLFLQNQGENVLKSFITEYNLENSNEEGIIHKLKTYINSIPMIYSSSPHSNSNEISYDDLGLGVKDINTDAAIVFAINFNIANINSNSDAFITNKIYKEDRNGIDWDKENSHCDLYPAMNIQFVDELN